MIQNFLTKFVAGVSEEMLVDLFKMIMREILLKRKKADIHSLVNDLKVVIDETANQDVSDVEKNIRLTAAGRAVIARLHKP